MLSKIKKYLQLKTVKLLIASIIAFLAFFGGLSKSKADETLYLEDSNIVAVAKLDTEGTREPLISDPLMEKMSDSVEEDVLSRVESEKEVGFDLNGNFWLALLQLLSTGLIVLKEIKLNDYKKLSEEVKELKDKNKELENELEALNRKIIADLEKRLDGK